MKKIVSIFLCLMLLITMAVTVYAEGTEDSQNGNGTVQNGNPPVPGDPDIGNGDQGGGDTHTHSYEETSNTATCGAAGTATYRCSCGDTFTKDIAATGNHTYGSWAATEDGKHTRTCSVCSNAEKGDHSYGEWQDEESSDSHYRTCSVCGNLQKGAHSWGAATVIEKPTCKEEGTMGYFCSGCDYVLLDPEPIPKLTTHTYDNACDPQCNVCELERQIEHTFTKVWSKNYKGHWHECTKCGEQADFAKHIPGPAATEEKEQVCLTCGYVVMPKKEHVHNYGTEWTSDEVGHWHACTGCKEEKDYASHSFDDACDPECNTCGYKRENSHTYDQEGWQVSSFDHWNVCSVCGEESEHEKHVPGPEATDEAAQVCTVCNYELAPILEHTHDFGTQYLTAQDSHWQKCKCGELSVPEAHVWDEGVENRNDTTTFTCMVCGAERVEETPSAGFPWLIVLLVILALICIGGIVALVIILKRGNFEDEDDLDESSDDMDAEPGADEEEKMIDDYFASLDGDIYK